MMTEDKQQNRILVLAKKRFFESGILAVTVESLAHELGISKKTMYQFFDSKSTLLEALIEQHLVQVTEELAELHNAPTDFLDKAISIWTFGGKTLSSASPLFHDDLQRYHPDLWQRLNGFYRERLLQSLTDQLSAGVKLSIFRSDINKDAVVMFFCAGIEKISDPATLAKHSFSADDAIKTIIQLVLDGVLADASRPVFRRRMSQEKPQAVTFKRVTLNNVD